MSLATPGRLLRFLLRIPAVVYRCRAGWVFGHRFLLLTHVGRRSGRIRRTVLEVVRFDRDSLEAVVVSGWGRGADWFRNIEAAPALEVAIGRRRFRPAQRILGEDEAAAVLAHYEHRNRLVRPVVRGALSRLIGQRYDGSDAGRDLLVRRLPFVAFRPAR